MDKTHFAKDIEAEVTFISPENGGRKKQIFCGYRPTFIYDNHAWDASLWFDGDEFHAQGEPVKVFFEFASPASHIGKLVIGKTFELHDGRLIAIGRVSQIVDLEDSAKKVLAKKD